MPKVAPQLEEVVRRLVDDRDAVAVEADDLGDTVVLRLSVAPDELGRVIGRQGRTVRALRSLLELRGSGDDVYYDLEVVEDDEDDLGEDDDAEDDSEDDAEDDAEDDVEDGDDDVEDDAELDDGEDDGD